MKTEKEIKSRINYLQRKIEEVQERDIRHNIFGILRIGGLMIERDTLLDVLGHKKQTRNDTRATGSRTHEFRTKDEWKTRTDTFNDSDDMARYDQEGY